MDPYYAQVLVMTLLASGGVSVLIWAAVSRQFRDTDQASFTVLDSDENWEPPATSPLGHKQRLGMAVVLAGIFACVLLSVGVTLVLANGGARNPAFQRELNDRDAGGLR